MVPIAALDQMEKYLFGCQISILLIEKFQKINEAYQTLSDQAKKKEYDNRINFGNQNFFNNNEHIFSHFFHGNMGPNVQVFHNGRPVYNQRRQPPSIDIKIPITLDNAYNGNTIKIEYEKKVQKQNYRVVEKQSINIDIPKGIKDNEMICIKEKGHEENGMKGDIRIFIKIQPVSYTHLTLPTNREV